MKAYPKYKECGIKWLGEIPEGWRSSKIKHELESLDSNRVPLSGEIRGAMEAKVYDYYGASGVIDRVEDYIFEETLILLGEDGANLYSRSTPLAFLAKGKYWVNNHAHILKPKNGNIDYFVNLLESVDYTKSITGSAQPKLTIDNLQNIAIPVSTLPEQQTIATYLDHKTRQIDRLIETKQKQVELFKEQRTAIINQAVTKGVVRIMFDSNAFDKLLENDLDITAFPSWYHFYSTQTQHDEIKQIKDKEKRDKLLDLFSAFKQIDNESLTPDDTTIDDPNTDLFQKLRGNNDRYDNDAMTGITVIRENMILVSEDERLRKKVKQNGGKAISFDEFKDGSFYKMKDSGIEWLGEIPEGWEVGKLKYLGQCQNGISAGAEYFGSGYPFISYGDVYGNIAIPNVASGLANSSEKDRASYSVQKGDVFFTRTSETIEEIGFTSTCLTTMENATFRDF